MRGCRSGQTGQTQVNTEKSVGSVPAKVRFLLPASYNRRLYYLRKRTVVAGVL